MNSILNKIIITFGIVVAAIIMINTCYGASIGLSVTYSTVTVGESTRLTITGNDAIGKVNITSSNPNVVSVSADSAWLEGSTTVTLTTKSVGSAVITVSGKLSNSSGSAENLLSNSITINSKAVYIDTRSSNNRLSGISVTGQSLVQEFDPEELNYSVRVSHDVTSIEVTASPEDAAASYEVTGNSDFHYGDDNMVTITVTAENGATRMYKLWVTRAKNPDDINTNLSEIIIENANMKEEFSKEKTTYILDDISNEISSLKIKAVPEIDGAKVEIIGNEKLKIGTNKIIIKVISKDESETKEYQIIVYKSDEMLSLAKVEEPEENLSLFGKIKKNYILVVVSAIAIIELIIIIAMAISKKAAESFENGFKNTNATLSKEDSEDENTTKTSGRRSRRDIE